MKYFNSALIVLLIFASSFSYAQLTVSSTMTPTQMIQNVLVGQGVTVSNVTFTGVSSAIGTFTTGAIPTNIGFSDGIIMTSGDATNAIGPNSSGSITGNNSAAGDTDLNGLITQTTNDASVIEFDFVPLSDTIKFQYVFASDEYHEFSTSSFNDIFAFFITGLNPATFTNYNGTNIALIPGTTQAVTMNNLNNGASNAGPCNYCQYLVDNTGGTTIEYDAFTTVLTAKAAVIPCLTYHLKLAIADVSDYAYDSGVFLKANSFGAPVINVDYSYSNPNVDSVAIEGCNDLILTFKLPQVKSVPTNITWFLSGSAQHMVDYDTLPSYVTIPAGQDSATITIHPFLDTLTEGTETITMVIPTSPCTFDTIYVDIHDYSPPDIDISNDTVLCFGVADLTATMSGGQGPYSYVWDTGDTIPDITVAPGVTTQYTVIANDLCPQYDTAQVTVFVSAPIISIQSDSVCAGDTAVLIATAIGGQDYLWDTGVNSDTLKVSPPMTSDYLVVVTDTLGCKDSLTGTAYVNAQPILDITPDTAICEGSTINIVATGGIDYVWSNGADTSTITVSPVTDTDYSVTVTDVNGCTDSTQMRVMLVEVPEALITAPRDTICKGESISLSASGGDSYRWNGGTLGPTLTVAPKLPARYILKASNTLNNTVCSDTDTFDLEVKRCNSYYFPNAFTPNGDGVNDVFKPGGIFKALDSYELLVYSRTGELIYYSTDPEKGWNGRYRNSGALSPDGVYTYFVRIKEHFTEVFELSGTVMLMGNTK